MKTDIRVFAALFCTALIASVLCSRVRATDCWQERGDAPAGRSSHTAVWTGTEMIVWGGYNGGELNTGGRYNPATNSWTTTTTTGAPSARRWHTAVWTGSEMIVWGGYDSVGATNTGGRYNPATNSWTAVTTTGALSPRRYHTAVWTGTEMIVWGGFSTGYSMSGGRYNPASNSWTTATTTRAPTGRAKHSAVWTGSEMIVWGGTDASSTPYLNTGGRYNPATNTWTAVTTTGAPVARREHPAVWTGTEMIVWGGGVGTTPYITNTGGRYNPTADSWTTLSTTGAPAARKLLPAVWTGTEMIVWGGSGSSVGMNTGGRYDPAGNSWTAVSTTSAPSERNSHTAVWTGSEMIVWGGGSSSTPSLSTGGSYTPDCGVFRVTGLVLDGGNLILSFPTVTGRNYTLWRSDALAGGTWTPSGLPSIPGDGTDKFFSVGAPVAGIPKRFYRVQAGP